MDKKRIIWLVLLVLWLGCVIYTFFDNKEVEETNYPSHSDYFFVEDYSKVLNEQTEKYIYNVACALETETKAQVAVVTVPNTQASDLEEFSITLANNWGIGDEKLDNGVLLLFDTTEDDPHVRLEIGKGLEGAIPDGKAGRILDDYAVEAKDNGEFNKAAGNTFVAVVKEIYSEYGKEAPEDLIFSEDWGDGSETTAGTFADMEFPEVITKKNDKPFVIQLKDAFIDGTYLAGGIFVVIAVIYILLGSVIGIFTGKGPFSGGRGGFFSSGGGGYSGGGHSGGGGSFGGGGASR